jgi:hypothetical protein
VNSLYDASLSSASVLVDTTNKQVGTSSVYLNNTSTPKRYVHLAPFNITTANTVSFSAWIRIPSLAAEYNSIICLQGSSFNTSIGLELSTKNVGLLVNPNGAYSTITPTLNTFVHYAVVCFPGFNGGYIYINGQKAYTRNDNYITNLPTGSYKIVLGGGPGVSMGSATGNIDDVRVYNRVLTDQEVLDIYNNYSLSPVIVNNGLIGNSVANYPYLSLPVIPQNVNGYSFSFSFTPSSNNQTGIIWSLNNSTNLSTNRIFMGLQGGNIQIGTGSTTYTSIIQPTINISNHYVWSMYTSGTSNIYVNGNTSSVITTTTVPYYNSTNFNNNALFSDPVGGNVAAGTISEFRYYDRTLGSNDIIQIYGNSVSRTQNTLGASNSLSSYFTGGIDEFQIYNRVLSSREVSQLSTTGTY